MSSKTNQVAAYEYDGVMYCPTCIVEVLAADGVELRPGVVTVHRVRDLVYQDSDGRTVSDGLECWNGCGRVLA